MLASHNSTESLGNPMIVMKVWLTVSGIYIWEFISTLDYEWSVIRRHQPYPRVIWIYSLSRLSGLVVIIVTLVNISASSPINCQAWVTSGWAISAVGCYGLSSILIMLRIFVIWDRNKVIMAISAVIWVINLGFQFTGVVKIRAVWMPVGGYCAVTNVVTCRGFYIIQLISDVILLFIMLAGLLRLRRGPGGSFYLSHLLWKQGVIWLVIATAAELPQALILFFNVNDSFDLLCLLPSMVAIIIAATRTHRSLIHCAFSKTHVDTPNSYNLQKTKRLASHTKDPSIVHVHSNRLEVTTHRANEEYPMSQMNHHDPYPSSDAQPTDEPGLDDNVEDRDNNK